LALPKREGSDPPFVFVGDGPLAGKLRDTITRAGLTHATTAGVLPPREAVKRMDVLVLSSESEAMPLVLVEALSAGHPCVATAVGGVPDLIRDGVEGFLLQDGAPATIADGIRRMSAMSPDVFGAMSSRARARYEECCTPERVGAVVEKHYRKVLG
jgi:glycosyltransferase involved in cell wall biosynthesis